MESYTFERVPHPQAWLSLITLPARAFLRLIGVLPMADGFGLEIPQGHLYFPPGFPVTVEAMNRGMRTRKTAH